MKILKNVTTVILFGILFLSSFTSAAVEVGDEVSGFLGKTSSGNKILASNYLGKVSIISFWATWCSHCMQELPVLSGIQEKAGVEDIQVIAINLKESRKIFKGISEVLADYDLILTHDKNGKISKRFGVESIPFMLIVGADGKVIAKHVGYDKKELPGLVQEINQAIRDAQVNESLPKD